MNQSINVNMTVNNLPEETCGPWMVVRIDGLKFWYFGTFDDKDRAETAAEEVGNGIVIRYEGE